MGEAFIFFKWKQHAEHVFYYTKHTFAQVNLKPIKSGHILVIPRRVVATLQDMTDEEAEDLMRVIRSITVHLKDTLNAKGYTIKCQDGRAAGQTVQHVHWHIIPREDPTTTPQPTAQELDVLNGMAQRLGLNTKEFPAVGLDVKDHAPRSFEAMASEAAVYRAAMQQASNQETTRKSEPQLLIGATAAAFVLYILFRCRA